MGLIRFIYYLASLQGSITRMKNHVADLECKAMPHCVDTSKVVVTSFRRTSSATVAALADARSNLKALEEEQAASQEQLKNGIAKLPDKQQRVVLLGVHIHHDTLEEIAHKLNRPLDEIMRTYHKAFDALDAIETWF